MGPEEMLLSRMTRAQMLRRAAGAGLGLTGLAALAGCGDDGGAPATTGAGTGTGEGPPAAADITGTITLLNYPGWMGPKTIPGFEAKYPGTKVRQTAAGFESLSGVAQTVAANPTAYDVMLAVTDQCEQLTAGGLVLKADPQTVPSMKLVDPNIAKMYPWGVATDTGVIGIGYRKDIVKEPIKSWKDFWEVVPKYSNRVVLVDVDRDALGSALLYLGKDGNSTDPADLEAAKKALLELKPHVKAFKVTGVAQTLLDGSAVLTMGYNFETAAAAAKNPNIVYVSPEEGAIAYIEGFIGISKTDNPDTVLGFLDWLGQPRQQGAHTNATTGGFVSKAAAPYTDKALLGPEYRLPDNVSLIKFLGADGVKLWNRTWAEYKAA